MSKEDHGRKSKAWAQAIQTMDDALKEIDAKMDELSEMNETVKHQKELLMSIDGIGKRIATLMFVLAQCFTAFHDARKFCIYAGVVPLSYDSGTSVRSKSKVSKRANQQVNYL